MPAYWRLMNWARNQPIESLQRRATTGLVFNDFLQRTNELRGTLLRLDMTVQRVLKHPAEKGNPAGVEHVYEIVGSTHQSQAWVYWVVVDELPEGMTLENGADQQVHFYGFFFKVQSYYPGGSGPNDKALLAPVLIGRMTLQRAPVAPQESDAWWPWLLVAGVAMVLFLMFLGSIMHYHRPAGPVVPRTADDERALSDWLQHPGDETAQSSDKPFGSTNGHG
jgi:hypothetical protein